MQASANPFQVVHLTTSEQLGGCILNQVQKAVLQNRRVEIAVQKLNTPYTPEHPLVYAQQEAFLRGQLDLIQWLLDSSEAAEAQQLLGE